MTKLSRIFLFLVCFLTSGTWLTQAYGQATLINLAPVGGGGTTGARAPNGTFASMRAVTIITGAELTPLLGATNSISQFGFTLSTGPNAAFGGTVNIYMLNTADVTYNKGLDWTVATTGMTQVCTNCAFTVPAASTNYDITLTTPFAYTGAGMYLAYDFTVTVPAPALTIAANYLANTVLPASIATNQGATVSNVLGTPGLSGFRPEFRFGTTNPFATDNIVAGIIAPGKMPVGSPSAFKQIKARVLNRGINNTANLTVTLNITGANSFTNTKVITGIIAGQDGNVTFDPFTPTIAGTNTVVVSIAADSNPNPNNSLSLALETTCNVFSYANNVVPGANNGIGFPAAGGLLLSKFKTTAGSSVTVSGVNIRISDNTATTGRDISGVLVSATGTVLATSVPYTVLAADLSTVKSFVFSPAIVIPAGAEFLAGLVQSAVIAPIPVYSPLASQNIASPVGFSPAQANIGGIDTDVLFAGSQPVAGATTLTLQTLNTRLMIDVITTSPNTTFINTVATAATVGTAYTLNAGATATSGTLAYTVAPALPGGLLLNATTGVISGTPLAVTASAAYTVTASASGACTATQTYTFAVVAGAPCPTITFTNTTIISPNPIVGTVYNLVGGATATSGTLTYSVLPALPVGLSISATGVIGGTPTASATSATYVVMASTSATCNATQSYTFAVIASVCPTLPSLTLAPAAASAGVLVSGTVGTPFNQTFTAGGIAGATYTYALTAGVVLPAGLSFASTAASATISGTPSVVTTVTVIVRATSNGGCVSPATSYTLVIGQNPATAIDNSLANLVKVSPNPSKGDFNVDFGTINMAKSSVRVYDAQGKVVFTSENNTNASGNLMTISLEKFANGIYLMEVETSKGRILKRLAKQ